MKNVSALMLSVILLLTAIVRVHAQADSQNPAQQKIVSIILKFSGKNGAIEQMELFSQNILTERTGDLTRPNPNITELFRVRFLSETGDLLYSEDFQNPLKEVKERYLPEGIVERKEEVKEAGYLNFRLMISNPIKNIRAVCSKINGEEEIEKASLDIKIAD